MAGCALADASRWLVGTEGRMQTVKNQTLLARRLRMVMVASGPLRDECLVEGISNTIPRAMACGLPTQIDQTNAGQDHGSMGAAGCQRAEQWFSLDAMVEAYRCLYSRVLAANIQ